MSIPLYTVDAFTDRAFAGNPAAVCLLGGEAWPSEAWMQAVAAEMNLSETAFVQQPTPPELSPEHPLEILQKTPPKRPSGTPSNTHTDSPLGNASEYVPHNAAGRLAKHDAVVLHPIRYFTPTVEVALCGHATLATAHVLFAHRGAPADQPIVFQTIENQTLTCRRGANQAITIDFPAHRLSMGQPAEAPAGLAEALGAAPEEVVEAGPFWIVRLRDAQAVCALQPDHAALAQIHWGESLGVAVTAAASDNSLGQRGAADFVSRVFAPAVGIAEDPVTGSAHCALGPYWAKRLGRSSLSAHQASRRGGDLQLRVRENRVEITGHAVTTVNGQWVGIAPTE